MRRNVLLLASVAAVAALAFPVAFVNANAGSTVWICATPQNADLDQAGYEALTWVQIKAIGKHGEAGSKTNIINYDTWDTKVIQKGKGMTDAGSPEIECARVPTDPGQILVRAAANANFNYAFRMIRNDPAYEGGTGTVIYNRGLVVGPARPFGKNEDFDLEVFTLALNQKEIVVDPGAGGVAPTNTVVPTITTDGTPQAGETITASTGTFTGDAVITYAYQWFAGGVAIAGATLAAFDLTAAQVGKIVTVRVIATNASGSASAFSAPTVAIIA